MLLLPGRLETNPGPNICCSGRLHWLKAESVKYGLPLWSLFLLWRVVALNAVCRAQRGRIKPKLFDCFSARLVVQSPMGGLPYCIVPRTTVGIWTCLMVNKRVHLEWLFCGFAVRVFRCLTHYRHFRGGFRYHLTLSCSKTCTHSLRSEKQIAVDPERLKRGCSFLPTRNHLSLYHYETQPDKPMPNHRLWIATKSLCRKLKHCIFSADTAMRKWKGVWRFH